MYTGEPNLNALFNTLYFFSKSEQTSAHSIFTIIVQNDYD